MVDRAWFLSDVTAVLKLGAFGTSVSNDQVLQIGTLIGFILQIQKSFLKRPLFTAEIFRELYQNNNNNNNNLR